LRKRFSKEGTVIDSGPEETANKNDTENKRNESSSENINNDMENRTIDPYSSFIESPRRAEMQNNSDSESEDKNVFKEPSRDKIEETYDPFANNIVEIRDSFLARKGHNI